MNNLPDFIMCNTGFMTVSKPSDAKELLEDIRDEDLREIKATGAKDPLEAIEHGILMGLSSGFCYTVRNLDGKVCLIFGVLQSHFTSNAGVVWMLGTKSIQTVAFEFLRNCKKWVQEMHNLFPCLYNLIDSRNTLHLKWLEWCEFELVRSIWDYGTGETAFIYFQKMKKG